MRQHGSAQLFVVLAFGLACSAVFTSINSVNVGSFSAILHSLDWASSQQAQTTKKRWPLEIADAEGHPIQTLVLTPQRGVVAALGTTDLHTCPLPDYRTEHLRLSLSSRSFSTINVSHLKGGSGPLVIAYFNVTEELWDDIISSQEYQVPMLLWNAHTGMQQELQLLIDPALRQGRRHHLAATTTVRKHYRYYQGKGQYANKTPRGLWNNHQSTVLLQHWLDYHRARGIGHFYIIDNEHNLSVPGLSESMAEDVTYIRAPYSNYDNYNCKRNGATSSGQSILENSIIRFAHTEWLLSVDLDEYIVPSASSFGGNLFNLIRHFSNWLCVGPGGQFTNLTCQPLKTSSYKQVFAITFSSFFLGAKADRIDFELDYRRKTIVRPELTRNLEIHYPYPKDLKQSFQALVPPRQGWMAHFSKPLEGFTMANLNTSEIFARMTTLTSALRSHR